MESKHLDILCDVCSSGLEEMGALVFSPPLARSTGSVAGARAIVVDKYHICVRCWPQLNRWMRTYGEDDRGE